VDLLELALARARHEAFDGVAGGDVSDLYPYP